MKEDKELRILESWRVNASEWIRAITEGKIESRALCTDRAIVDAVMQRQPRTVLDLGCGEGWLVRELSKREVHVTGVDATAELIHFARGLGGGDFLVMSFSDVAKGDLESTYDVVVCNFSLMGKESVDELVAYIPKLLNPGGVFTIQTVHPQSVADPAPEQDGWQDGVWSGLKGDFRDPAKWYFRTINGWVTLLSECGFSSVVDEPIHPETGKPASLVITSQRMESQTH